MFGPSEILITMEQAAQSRVVGQQILALRMLSLLYEHPKIKYFYKKEHV